MCSKTACNISFGSYGVCVQEIQPFLRFTYLLSTQLSRFQVTNNIRPVLHDMRTAVYFFFSQSPPLALGRAMLSSLKSFWSCYKMFLK